jgi:hypothetical protein
VDGEGRKFRSVMGCLKVAGDGVKWCTVLGRDKVIIILKD